MPPKRKASAPDVPSFYEALRYWLKLGFISFGGPAGQIAIMHRDIVEKNRWMEEEHFLHALNFCMLLPGPEAQQLATYIGWNLHRKWGGIIAGILFVLPAVFILWALAWIYARLGNIPGVAALFYGLKPAVVAIVAEAVLRIGRKSLKTPFLLALAAGAFVAIAFFHVPFPLLVLSAGIIGFLAGRHAPHLLNRGSSLRSPSDAGAIPAQSSAPKGAAWRRSAKVAGIGLSLWFLPLAVLVVWRGREDIFVEIGILFSKAAVVTFGGAYAVLGYIGQQAVNHYGWLTPEQMMDGLALAETTPGPLIMVNQFVAYLAAYLHAPGLSPSFAGAIGGLLATWVTFVPSLLMIFLGAPYIERLRRNAGLSAALAAITASVVGVVLNLGVIFTRHALLPEEGGFEWYALVASIVAFAGLVRFKWGIIPLITGSALAGYAWRMLF